MILEPKQFAVIQPMLKEAWESLDGVAQAALALDIILAGAQRNPEVAGYLESTAEYQVIELAEIEGLKLLNFDEDGNPLPEMVAVRGTILAFPAEGVTVG